MRVQARVRRLLARALAATGDYLEEEPYCAYVPRTLRKATGDEHVSNTPNTVKHPVQKTGFPLPPEVRTATAERAPA